MNRRTLFRLAGGTLGAALARSKPKAPAPLPPVPNVALSSLAPATQLTPRQLQAYDFEVLGDGVRRLWPMPHRVQLQFGNTETSCWGVVDEYRDHAHYYYPLFGTIGGVLWTFVPASNALVRYPALPMGTVARWRYVA